MKLLPPFPWRPRAGFLSRLAKDSSGNTLALIAAGMLPMVAMVGSGIDMGRAYVTQSRLQQACDAGVLAARKRLGSDLPPSQAVIGEVRTVGNKFFNLNFEQGRYGTNQRNFKMILEPDFAITGSAAVEMPTAIMGIFGFNTIPIAVDCGSRMNFTNLDIMMVLDVTGSMRRTNAGDTLPRIDSMRAVIKNFHANLELAKTPETRVRYGFVPYATNVNVGALLKDDWVVKNWTYQSRERSGSKTTMTATDYNQGWTAVSGTRSDWIVQSTYAATWNNPVSGDQTGYYSCDKATPASSWTYTNTNTGVTDTRAVTNPNGTETFEIWERLHNGTRYVTRRSGSTCSIESSTDTNYKQKYERVISKTREIDQYLYRPIQYDVKDWRTQTNGCIEERASSKITDYSNVDLTINRDLDINSVPQKLKDETKWKPHFPNYIWAREINDWNGSGSFTVAEVTSTTEFADVGWWWFSHCPAPAQKLAEMDATALDTYLSTLSANGATYHDMGMIWGGRLLSQNGLFAAENKDESGNKPTARHLIFLTDGQTEPYDLAYGPYGVEPLDQRRWTETSALTLAETVEERFKFACNEVKKNNSTVWVIAFGTAVNPTMTECAGAGRYFEAKDAAELDEAFNAIARAMGDLRINK